MNERLKRLQEELPAGVDAALITSVSNRHYYTGFLSSAGTLLAGREKCFFYIDSRYFEDACARIEGCEVVLQDELYEQLGAAVAVQRWKALAVESDEMSLHSYDRLRQKLAVELLSDHRLSDLVAAHRSRKSPRELACIRRAQGITDRTFTHILDYIRPGRTEREIALEMEFYSRRIGSEEAAFAFIVVSGKNSSLPHGVPSDKPVERGDFITLDFGATVEGYRSDMTRTVAVKEASDKQRDVYETVLRAQQAGFAAIRPGVPCNEVDAAARELIDTGAYKGCFGHGLGHSLGLDIHEPPRFSPTCTTPLEPGMVLSVEPGVYLPGEFGVRIEDIVVVTAEGYENLTGSPKELILI